MHFVHYTNTFQFTTLYFEGKRVSIPGLSSPEINSLFLSLFFSLTFYLSLFVSVFFVIFCYGWFQIFSIVLIIHSYFSFIQLQGSLLHALAQSPINVQPFTHFNVLPFIQVNTTESFELIILPKFHSNFKNITYFPHSVFHISH